MWSFSPEADVIGTATVPKSDLTKQVNRSFWTYDTSFVKIPFQYAGSF